MSEPLAPQGGKEPEEIAQAPPATVASRLALSQRTGGIIVPVLTAVLAFLIGGLLVLATGHNPFQAYWDIVKGAGLNWLAHPTHTDVADTAAYNFSQTLLQTTTLILTGLAVAFAFRCGMFNIGGNGQYLVGLFAANWVGVSFVNMSRPAHILIGIGLATLAGAVWAGIAGFLKATVGAHEVITTIMLNWIAYWIGSYLFQQGGPLQGPQNKPLDIPISGNIVEGARLPVFWGDAQLQGLHIGFFVAIAALVAFWLILNRTTLGYEVRAVGYNPAAAAYGGIRVRTTTSGRWRSRGVRRPRGRARHARLPLQGGHIRRPGRVGRLPGDRGRAARSEHRPRRRARGLPVRRAAVRTTHGLQSGTIDPSLAGHLTEMIQGLVVLFVGADVLILSVWGWRRRLRRKRGTAEPAEAAAT